MRRLLLVLWLGGCNEPPPSPAPAPSASAAPLASVKPAIPDSWMTLQSPAFKHGEPIPAKYTCEGSNVSPPLEWTQVPGGTKTLALIVEDPDAPDPEVPKMTWGHWVLYNIPPDVSELPEGVKRLKGTSEGYNDYKRARYEGPCPPRGRHRYFFKLYALDNSPGYPEYPLRTDMLRLMEGHILGMAELMGTYEKKGQ